MRKVGQSIAGVAASALVAGGAFGVEVMAHEAKQDAVFECTDELEGDAQLRCIDDAEGAYSVEGATGFLQFVGVIGVAGCGLMGYRALQEEQDTPVSETPRS